METYIIPDWAAVIVEFGYNDNTTEQEDERFEEFVQALGPLKYMRIGNEVGFKPYNDVDRLGNECYELFVKRKP